MKKPKRIDRNNYDPERVLEIVREQYADHDSDVPVLGHDELLRLLEESAQAYFILRQEARDLVSAIDDAHELLDTVLMRLLGWR